MAVLLSFCTALTAFANEKGTEIFASSIDNFDTRIMPGLPTENTFSVKQVLTLGDKTVYLYTTFDEPDEALSNIKVSCSNVICLLKEVFQLDEFSSDTWELYQNALYVMHDSEKRPDWYMESNSEIASLRFFFDIYENDSQNKDIIRQATLKRSASQLLTDVDFITSLPYTSDVVQDYLKDKAMIMPRAYSKDKAIAYATKYASNPNREGYYYFSGGDCANFTSQILEAAGVGQAVYDSEYSGWWHKKTWLGHTHSKSWTIANTFARYMGVGYTSRNHASFSANLQAGDFIAYDDSSDGDWNHMGFVTQVDNYKTNGYYDYKVAQHTTNYHAWVSSSTNGWENLQANGATYGRVRR